MTVKLLTEHHLEFLSLTGGCRGSSEATHVKMPHCWKSHAAAQYYLICFSDWMEWAPPENILRVLMCLRIMMRDSKYQKHLFDLGGVKVLSEVN